MVVLNIIVMLLLALFVVWLLLNLRARHLDQQDGAFRAWARLDSHSGWMSGIGQYQGDRLCWYRLVAPSLKPHVVLPRHGLEVSLPMQRSTDGSMVEVRLTSGDVFLDIAVEPLTYNGLVSWGESEPPAIEHGSTL